MKIFALDALALLVASQASYAQSDFAVASVKPNLLVNAKSEGTDGQKIAVSPSGLIMSNVTLRTCIQWAWDVRDYQIAGPAWLAFQRYDISAKADRDVPIEKMRAMLRGLLADRFRLVIHTEAKDLPVYEMTLRKHGEKFKPADTTDDDAAMTPAGGMLEFRRCSMAEFAEKLKQRPFNLDRIVIDKTGMAGSYDFRIELAADAATMKSTLEGMEKDSQGAASMLDIVQEQLGLALRAARASVQSLTVEHAEKIPTEN